MTISYQEYLNLYYPDKSVSEILITADKKVSEGVYVGVLTGTLNLTGYNNLTSFKLEANAINNAQYLSVIQAIPNKEKITTLGFYNNPIADPNFTYLANNFPNLEWLSFLICTTNKDINFKDLTKLTKLKNLWLGDGNNDLLIRTYANIPPTLTHFYGIQLLNNPLTPYFAQLGNPKMSLLLQRNKNIQQLKEELKDKVLLTTSKKELSDKWKQYPQSILLYQSQHKGEYSVLFVNKEKQKSVSYVFVNGDDWRTKTTQEVDSFLNPVGLKLEYLVGWGNANLNNDLNISGYTAMGIIETLLNKIKKAEQYNLGDEKKDQGVNNYVYDWNWNSSDWPEALRIQQRNDLQKAYESITGEDVSNNQEKHTDKDLKPTDLPDNWKTELARIPELEKRPTQEQLNQAVQGEKDKYNNLPTDWKAKLDEFLEVEKGRIKTELPAFFQSVAVGIDNIKKRFENDEEWKKQNGITVFDYEDIISKKLTLDNKENMRGDFKLVSCICATEKVGDTIENLSPTAKKNYLPTIKKVQAGWEKVELYQQIGAKNSPFYLDIIKQRQVYKTKIEKWINEIESQNLQTQPPK